MKNYDRTDQPDEQESLYPDDFFLDEFGERLDASDDTNDTEPEETPIIWDDEAEMISFYERTPQEKLNPDENPDLRSTAPESSAGFESGQIPPRPTPPEPTGQDILDRPEDRP